MLMDTVPLEKLCPHYKKPSQNQDSIISWLEGMIVPLFLFVYYVLKHTETKTFLGGKNCLKNKFGKKTPFFFLKRKTRNSE